MSGDLDDFLRRAAKRRQAAAGGGGGGGQRRGTQHGSGGSRPRRPEYTDSRTERLPQAGRTEEEPEELVLGEILDEHDELAKKQAAVRAARKHAAEAAADAKKHSEQARQADRDRPVAPLGSNPGQELMRMLKQPAGLRQAMLLKEILDRPEHRW